MTQINIIGAGLAGLLAGNMLRHRATIIEKQPELPNNHRALLRFRSGIFGQVLGIPFKKVRMVKAVYGDNSNPIRNELNYALKTTGQMRSDRSLPVGVVKEDRFVAPDDLINQMAAGCHIQFGTSIDDCDKDLLGKPTQNKDDPPLISTIPMPELMRFLDYPKRHDIKFNSIEGSVITAVIENCDAYATYYFPDHNTAAYRASITGNKFILELTDQQKFVVDDGSNQELLHFYARIFGIEKINISTVEFHKMRYAKILPIDEDARKEFMHWATVNYNIYSLGRFATWRPGLLLDDLVQDVSLISGWVLKGGKYNAARHWS